MNIKLGINILAWHWVPATVIENDPRYQDLLIKFNKSIRKH